MTTPNEPTMSRDSLDALIAAYMLAVETGEVPNRQELLDRHPELAEALRGFFADLDRMDRVASPLRIADGLDATNDVEGNGHGDLPTIRYVGDYALLERIAKGGMGIVYKARQVSLNRIVALKMILQGTFATEREVARFRAEAEAAANLDHPHIVPIYEVGEHEGQQYYSMKLIEGRSLAAVPSADPRREVEDLLPVIRAVHHAHQRGVLHRDLKPSNVLVDSSGSRHVADFGLAKLISDSSRSITETGQILGTPRYTSPEQAAGRKDLTVASDVYSLGVILYERLTGQTPFTGENALTLLRQTRESEPPRPASIRAGLDRDLETVVLKCLEKESERRYSSAVALADDLDRWHRGEPILARPVGRFERSRLWVRRNPVLSAAGGLAITLMAVVTVISSIAALQAQALAKAERERSEIVKQANVQAIADRDSVERALARSYVTPLTVDDLPEDRSLLSTEAKALWQLAENPGERVWLCFIDVATGNSFGVRPLGIRADPAMIAAVGLDSVKRNKAAKLLAGRLLDKSSFPNERVELATIALELEDLTDSTGLEYSEFVSHALKTKPSDPSFWVTYPALLKIGERIDPASVARWLAAEIVAEPTFYCHYCNDLVSVSERLSPSQASSLCTPVARALAASLAKADFAQQSNVADGLSSIVDRMEPAEAAQILASAVTHSKHDNVTLTLALRLSFVASRMKSGRGAEVCTPIVQLLAKELAQVEPVDEYDGSVYFPRASNLALALTHVATCLEPVEARNVCDSAARKLCDIMEKDAKKGSAEGLASIVKLMDRGVAAELCGRVARAEVAMMENEKDGSARNRLAERLVFLAEWVQADEADELCSRAGRVLTAAAEKLPNGDPQEQLFYGLAAVASQMKPAEGARILLHLLKSEKLQGDEGIARLITLARRMTPTEAEDMSNQAIRYYLQKRSAWSVPKIAFFLTAMRSEKANRIALEVARLICFGHNSPNWWGGLLEFDAALGTEVRVRAPSFLVVSFESVRPNIASNPHLVGSPPKNSSSS